jgi:hypothetical protein
MKWSRLAKAVNVEAQSEGLSISAVAQRIGRSQGAMVHLLAEGRRASPETMAVLSRGWKEPGAGARVMIAHLQDELERAKWPVHDYHIEFHDGRGGKTVSHLEADIADFRAAVEYVPALACLLSDVLAIAKAELPAELFGNDENIKKLIAAEDRADYDAGKKKRK